MTTTGVRKRCRGQIRPFFPGRSSGQEMAVGVENIRRRDQERKKEKKKIPCGWPFPFFKVLHQVVVEVVLVVVVVVNKPKSHRKSGRVIFCVRANGPGQRLKGEHKEVHPVWCLRHTPLFHGALLRWKTMTRQNAPSSSPSNCFRRRRRTGSTSCRPERKKKER